MSDWIDAEINRVLFEKRGCVVCKMRVLPGHGHMKQDGTITDKARIFWMEELG